MLSKIKNFYDEFSMTKKRIDNMIPVIEIDQGGLCEEALAQVINRSIRKMIDKVYITCEE